jgi:hypothetical protein
MLRPRRSPFVIAGAQLNAPATLLWRSLMLKCTWEAVERIRINKEEFKGTLVYFEQARASKNA